MRMRPGKPLPSLSVVTSGTIGTNDRKKKRKREKHKLIRARRRTIDPTKWDSQHLKGAFLDSIVVADNDDTLPVTAPSRPDTRDDQEDDLSSGEGEEDSSEPESTFGGSPTTPDTTNRPPPIAHKKSGTVDTDHDFTEEKLRALSLLDSIFGGLEGGQEWGGKEALDSDIDMPELPPVRMSPSPKFPPKRVFEEPDPVAVVEEATRNSESEESSTDTATPVPERDLVSATVQNANATKAKLKELFAPREEQGVSPPTDHLSQI